MIPGGNMNYTQAAYQQMLSLAGYSAQQAALTASANANRNPFQGAFPGIQIILCIIYYLIFYLVSLRLEQFDFV